MLAIENRWSGTRKHMNETKASICKILSAMLLVWAAINAAFLCSWHSLIFVSVLFFGGGHFDEEY